MLETEENEIQIYYEPEEILMNRITQAKDQFEELLKMRISAAEPKRSKFNILDFAPVEQTSEENIKKTSKQSKRKGKKNFMKDIGESDI